MKRDLNDKLAQVLNDQSKLLKIIDAQQVEAELNLKNKMKEDTAHNIINFYRNHLILEGLAKSTVSGYISNVLKFIKWLKVSDNIFTGEISREDVLRFREALLDSEYTPKTINSILNSLCSFNKFLIVESYQEKMVVIMRKDRIKFAKGSERNVEVFSEDEISTMLTFLNDNPQVSLEQKLIVYLLLYTGIRLNELISIKISDIDFENRYLVITYGKGNKMRDIPLKLELIALIKQYIEKERSFHKLRDQEELFLPSQPAVLYAGEVNKVLKLLSEKLSTRVHAHKFRHTFATTLIKKDVNITTVSALLGHSSVETTVSYYLSISREDKNKAIELL